MTLHHVNKVIHCNYKKQRVFVLYVLINITLTLHYLLQHLLLEGT